MSHALILGRTSSADCVSTREISPFISYALMAGSAEPATMRGAWAAKGSLSRQDGTPCLVNVDSPWINSAFVLRTIHTVLTFGLFRGFTSSAVNVNVVACVTAAAVGPVLHVIDNQPYKNAILRNLRLDSRAEFHHCG